MNDFDLIHHNQPLLVITYKMWSKHILPAVDITMRVWFMPRSPLGPVANPFAMVSYTANSCDYCNTVVLPTLHKLCIKKLLMPGWGDPRTIYAAAQTPPIPVPTFAIVNIDHKKHDVDVVEIFSSTDMDRLIKTVKRFTT